MFGIFSALCSSFIFTIKTNSTLIRFILTPLYRGKKQTAVNPNLLFLLFNQSNAFTDNPSALFPPSLEELLVKENPMLTFLTRSSWTSPGGSGRTLLFRHPITSPRTSAQPGTRATKTSASSPQQLIQHTPDISHPGCAHTGAEVHEESWQDPRASPRGRASTGAHLSHKFMNPFCAHRSSGFILAPICWHQITQPPWRINANKTARAQFVQILTSQSSSILTFHGRHKASF